MNTLSLLLPTSTAILLKPWEVSPYFPPTNTGVACGQTWLWMIDQTNIDENVSLQTQRPAPLCQSVRNFSQLVLMWELTLSAKVQYVSGREHANANVFFFQFSLRKYWCQRNWYSYLRIWRFHLLLSNRSNLDIVTQYWLLLEDLSNKAGQNQSAGHWHIITQPLPKPFITYHFINLLNAKALKKEVCKEWTSCWQTSIK